MASSAWLLSPLLVLSLLVGGFFAYGAWTRSQPTHYARGGDTFALAPSAPAGHTHAGTTPGRHALRASKGTKRTRVATTAGGVVAAPRQQAGGHQSAGQSSDGASTGTSDGGTTTAPSAPAAGTYALAVDGSEHVKFGPFSACSNTFPTRSSLVVHPASGEPAGSYDFDLRFYPSSPNRHDERHIYRYGAAGVSLSYEQATVTCGGIKQSSTVNFNPPQTRVEYPLSAGAAWHSDGGDSGRTEKTTSQVVGTTHVVVAGHSYLTWIIDTHVTMSGDETGSRDQRWWWSPDLAMPVKWHESLSGNRSGAAYSEDVTVSVVGLP